MRRLLQQVVAAEERAQRAEDALAGERQSKDWLMLQLASRLAVKSGTYGLDHQVPQKTTEQPPAKHPRGFVRDPNEHDNARLEYYKQCYREQGRPEVEAEALWEAEMRGENVTYEYEQEN